MDFIFILITLASTFFITWLFYLRTQKASWVDTIWSLNHGWIVLWLYLTSSAQSTANILYLIMYLLWSIRLAIYLGWRTAHSKEDQRYVNIEKRWKKNPKFRMLRFFGIQAIINLMLCTPAWFLFHYSAENMDYSSSPFPWVGFCLFLIGLIGETLADLQLALHKRKKTPNSICSTGLWKYSRHPNYFFEFLIWASVALFLLGLPYGWIFITLPMVHVIPIAIQNRHSRNRKTHGSFQRRKIQRIPKMHIQVFSSPSSKIKHKLLSIKQQLLTMNWKIIDTLLSYHLIPDAILRYNIQKLLRQRLEEEKQKRGENLSQSEQVELNWVQTLKNSPIAIQTDKANEQHYEVPTEFYHYALGKHLKYSSGFQKQVEDSLDQMEEQMLDLYCERAKLQDGQSILDLGCGWGSLSLFLAKKYPNSSISSLSNSATQRQYIEEQTKEKGINNIRVCTEDMNKVQFKDSFDRILSIEMFEHLRNYQLVFKKVSEWLKPDGLVFLHIFCHDSFSYPFEVKSEKDWMSKYFFSGGQMPASNLFHRFDKDLTIRKHWKVNGKHYARTSLHWLNNINKNKIQIMQLFKKIYPNREAHKMFEYWRLFFMSCEELFQWNNGEEWYVGHYLLGKSAK